MNQFRQLAAIMFTDIVGYTALMQENEKDAVALIKHYNAALNHTVHLHSGKVLNYYGDGSLCTFPSVTEALICAMELQNELQSVPAVPLRIGLHVGEVFFEDKKALGDGVNVASRIQSLGQANTILFSKEIFDKIKNHPEFKPVSLGQFIFKNVNEPMEVFALANEGLIVPRKEKMSGKLKEPPKKTIRKKLIVIVVIALVLLIGMIAYKKFSNKNEIEAKDKTIAVLPFKNVSINKDENEPFCVGVALELQRKLEWLGGLIPIASQSVEKYRDTKLSIEDISNELGGVKYIVQGNVLRDQNKVKVFVSLSNAGNGEVLWSDEYFGEMEDVFSLQENIAEKIASALKVKITPDEKYLIARVPTKNIKALDAYNEALTSYVKLATEVHPLYWDSLPSNPRLYSEYLKTLLLCDKAINMDPSMAEAYVLKGQTYLYSIFDWFATKTKQDMVLDSVELLGRKALQIDKSSADAYLLIAKCFNLSDSTLLYLEKAVAINANSFDANRELGGYYIWTNPEKGIRYCKKAIRLNPLSVWTPLVYRDLGLAYHNFGDFEKAELYGKKAIELSNNSMIAIETRRGLTITYEHWGKADSAIKYANQYANQNVNKEVNALYDIAEAYCNLKNDCAKAAELYEKLWNRYKNHVNINRWAVALMNIGKTKEAKEKIEQAFTEYKERGDTLSYDYAGLCALNGDKLKALEILRKWDWQWGSPYLIQHDKIFDNIRNEKEFKVLVQKALDEKRKLRERISKMEENGEL